MNKDKKYLKIYEDCMKIGKIPFLCWMFNDAFSGVTKDDKLMKRLGLESVNDEIFKLFIPDELELEEHLANGYSRGAWGLTQKEGKSKPFHPSELRQNILLFMAAMNNEL